MLNKEDVLMVGDYIKATYKDEHAHLKFDAFLNGLNVGYREGIAQAASYVHNWHTHMDSLHEGHTKGLIREIEHGILELEFGDV